MLDKEVSHCLPRSFILRLVLDPHAVSIHLISKQDHWQTAMTVLAAQETAEILLGGQLHMATPDTSCLSIQRSSWRCICLVAKAQDHGRVQCLIPSLIKPNGTRDELFHPRCL